MPRDSDRRFLSFPAVRPCRSVSPATLLLDLIALSHQICSYGSALSPACFPILNHGLRQAIRSVGVLLVFLEELRDWGCGDDDLPASAVLCLSELHVAYQKIRHLLQDCSSRGARLLVLMRSNWVSCDLRILIRSIANALEVLPLNSINVGGDGKVFVELIKRQASKAVIAGDGAATDDGAACTVHSILSDFEKGICPDPADLRRVLNQLGIQSWAECNQETLFLEEEIQCAVSEGEKGESEAMLLSSLIGFMTYCRAILFDVFDHRKRSDQSDCKVGGRGFLKQVNMENFICPITLELMADPVTVSTGQTYDRSSIVRWIGAGNLTCPVTGEKLKHTELVPNSILRKFIRQFCCENNISIPEPTSSGQRRRSSAKASLPISAAAVGATKMLANFLIGRLSNGTREGRKKAAYEIRLLSKLSFFHRACLVEAGSVPKLINLLPSADPWLQETAIATILNLSKHPIGRKVVFESGGLRPILDVLREGLRMEAQQNAAATVFYLSSVDEYRTAIGDIPEAIQALVDLLRTGTIRGKKNAIAAIFGLLLFPGNHPKVLADGSIPNFINLLYSQREELVTDSLAVLATLAERPEGANALLRSSSAVAKLVDILGFSPSLPAKEYCVSVLRSLCINGGPKVVNVLDRAPSLMSSLYSLLREGSSQARQNASSLISIIHHLHDPSVTQALYFS